MPSNSAEYMRSYRARRKADAADMEAFLAHEIPNATANARIAELEAEVRHLKAELAKRPPETAMLHPVVEPGFNTQPFRPVPKK